MKKMIAGVVLSVTTFAHAGIVRHVVVPAAKVSAKAAKVGAKASAKAAVKVAKVGKKVIV